MTSMSAPFSLTIDWLAFTLPNGSAQDTMLVLGGDWTKSEGGFRGYPVSWITAGATRGIGKLGTGALRAPREEHVDLSAGIVASWPIEKVRTVLQWVLSLDGHFTRLDCALDDRASRVLLSTIREAVDAGQCVTRADRMQRIASASIHKGTPSGETIYIGSPHSQTLLRIYDKRFLVSSRIIRAALRGVNPPGVMRLASLLLLKTLATLPDLDRWSIRLIMGQQGPDHPGIVVG